MFFRVCLGPIAQGESSPTGARAVPPASRALTRRGSLRAGAAAGCLPSPVSRPEDKACSPSGAPCYWARASPRNIANQINKGQTNQNQNPSRPSVTFKFMNYTTYVCTPSLQKYLAFRHPCSQSSILWVSQTEISIYMGRVAYKWYNQECKNMNT